MVPSVRPVTADTTPLVSLSEFGRYPSPRPARFRLPSEWAPRMTDTESCTRPGPLAAGGINFPVPVGEPIGSQKPDGEARAYS